MIFSSDRERLSNPPLIENNVFIVIMIFGDDGGVGKIPVIAL